MYRLTHGYGEYTRGDYTGRSLRAVPITAEGIPRNHGLTNL